MALYIPVDEKFDYKNKKGQTVTLSINENAFVLSNLTTGASKLFVKEQPVLSREHPSFFQVQGKLEAPAFLKMLTFIENEDETNDFSISSVSVITGDFLEYLVTTICFYAKYEENFYIPHIYHELIVLIESKKRPGSVSIDSLYDENLFLLKTLLFPNVDESKGQDYLFKVLLDIDEFSLREHGQIIDKNCIDENGNIGLAYTTYPDNESVEIQSTFNINDMTVKTVYSDPNVSEDEKEFVVYNEKYNPDNSEDLKSLSEFFECAEFDHLISYDCEYEKLRDEYLQELNK